MVVIDTKGNIKVATSIQENEILWIAKGFDIEWLVFRFGGRITQAIPSGCISNNVRSGA